MNKLDSSLIVRYTCMFSWDFNWWPLITIISDKLLTLCVTVCDLQIIHRTSEDTNLALIELLNWALIELSFISEFLIDRETCIRDSGLGSREMQLLLLHDDDSWLTFKALFRGSKNYNASLPYIFKISPLNLLTFCWYDFHTTTPSPLHSRQFQTILKFASEMEVSRQYNH